MVKRRIIADARRSAKTFLGTLAVLAVLACSRAPSTSPIDVSPPPQPVAVSSASAAPSAAEAARSTSLEDAPPDAAPKRADVDGPHDLPLAPGRPIFYAYPRPDDAHAPPYRLVAHLHGVCGPPSYACGKWIKAGVDAGVMVCPTGNAHCGDSAMGPPSWEAPTWGELVTAMDQDLESSIKKVEAKHEGLVRRDGAVLTGYSRGAYAAAPIARAHPGKYPYLVLIEANVPLSAEGLGKSGVRAVALVAGDKGDEIAGLRKTEAALGRAGFPAKLFVMRGTGHLYSDDMEQVMADALAFVLAH